MFKFTLSVNKIAIDEHEHEEQHERVGAGRQGPAEDAHAAGVPRELEEPHQPRQHRHCRRRRGAEQAHEQVEGKRGDEVEGEPRGQVVADDAAPVDDRHR